MARRPPYLHLSRHHVYYCRRAVPPDLRPILQQRELKRSLGRITYGDAVRSVIIFSYQTEALFMHLRNKSKSFAGYGCLGMIVKGMHMHRDGSVSFDEIQTDATADPEVEVRYLRTLTSRATDSDDSGIPPAAAQQVAAPPQSTNHPLSAAIETYCREKRQGGTWTEKTEQENRAKFQLLVRILGDIDCAAFTKDHAITVKGWLQKLPPNIYKAKAYRGRSLSAIVDESPTPMALNTINTYLARYSALFEWARLNTSVTENFFTGLAIKRRKRAADDREPFSAEDLSAIFTQPVYTELKCKHPYQYWLPLLALLTGARINELAQLHVADVEQDDNSCFLSINRDTSDKTLKNAASERRIPLHSRLAELGFLDYVAHLQHRGQDRVFPELPQGRDGYSKNASRWFNNSFKRDCGISHPKKVFHSFRHTFATALKHNQIPEGHAKALLGHTNSSITYDHYGKEYPLHQLAGAIEQLDYSNALHAVEPFSVSSG